MSAIQGPRLVTNDLVFYVDAGNTKGYDGFENLVTNSEAFNLWPINNGSGITISVNAETAPNGTLTADTFAQSAALSATRYLASNLSVSYTGQTYTISCWVKKVSGSDLGGQLYFQFIGDPTRNSLINATSDWQRFSWIQTLPIGGGAIIGFQSTWDINGAANNNVYALWGFQVELSSTMGEYYPTTSTTKLRGNPLYDISKNDYTGSLINSPIFNTGNRGNITLDGVNEYVNFGDVLSFGTSSVTLGAWIKTTASQDYATIIGKPFFGGKIGRYSLHTKSNGKLGIITHPSTGTVETETAENLINTGNWTFVVGVIDRNLGNLLYINAELESQIASVSTGENWSTTDDFTIGYYNGNGSGYFNGSVALAFVYYRALTVEEILQNYNRMKSRFGIN
jgi:hypothetical protein